MNQNYQQQRYQQQQPNYQQAPYHQQYQQQQQNMQIKNPQTNLLPTVKGPQMNDRDRLNDMLATEKHLADGYNMFVKEASHQDLHKDALQILNNTHRLTRDLFNEMFNYGWYSMQAETSQEIAKTQQKFSNYQSQFSANQFPSYQNQMF